MKSNLTIDF